MRAWMLCMAIGIGLIAYLPFLPPLWPALVAVLSLCAVWWRRRRPFYVALLAFSIGALWGIGYGQLICRELLPIELEQQALLLTGTVDSLVEQSTGFRERPVLHWTLRVERCQRIPAGECNVELHSVLLTAYDADFLPRGGERWQLRAKLKRPRGFANPGGFDYEAWLVAQRIGAVGTVEADAINRRLATAPPWSVEHWRGVFKNYLDRRLQTFAHRDLLIGLLIGDGGAIEQRAWNTFRATGTVHLFVVSGLQIAFTGGLALWFSRLWWRSPWSRQRRRDYFIGVLPALLVATLYALLAGFGLPIQRALIMFFIVAWALVMRRDVGADAWVLALWLVVLSNPLAVLDAGFWFSFIAVAVILSRIYGLRSVQTRYKKRVLWWRVQSALFISSLPLLLALTGQFTLLSLPANALAVPWSTFITMPLAFLALLLDGVLPDCGALLWRLADLSLDALWRYLCALQQWGAVLIWQPAGLTIGALLGASVYALLLLLPRGTPARGWAWLFLAPLYWPALEPIDSGDCRITVIDVGQGLSVLVQTAAHNLLYDTGPLFGRERTAAELTIVPLLRRNGIAALDTVIVSHKDSDHAGGWPTIAAQFAVSRLLVGELLVAQNPAVQSSVGTVDATRRSAEKITEQALDKIMDNKIEKIVAPRTEKKTQSKNNEMANEKNNGATNQKNTTPIQVPASLSAMLSTLSDSLASTDDSRIAPAPLICRDDMQWSWDGVEFSVVYPRPGDSGTGNNRSCVLQIDAGGALILLPGDIERIAEQRLLDRALRAPVELLLAPHHGSRSSSTPAWVERLRPRYVVFSTGYLNRFRHPSPAVVERYRQSGAVLFDTAYSGALIFAIQRGGVAQITQQRLVSSHYWQVAGRPAQ